MVLQLLRYAIILGILDLIGSIFKYWKEFEQFTSTHTGNVLNLHYEQMKKVGSKDCMAVIYYLDNRVRIQRGAGGPEPPPPQKKNHKNIGFLCNIGPDRLNNHKATKPAFNVGPSSSRQRNAI